MLSKLINYDLIALFKKFVPIWSLVIIMSILNGILLKYENYINNNFLVEDLPRIAFVAIIAVAIVIAIFYVCGEFYDGLLGKRGYFMFSIPARTESLILSKSITALVLECISLLVAITTGIIIIEFFLPDFTIIILEEIFNKCSEDVMVLILIIESALFIIILMITTNFHIYTSISIGHLSMKYRKMLSISSFIILSIIFIYIGSNIIPSMLFSLVPRIYTTSGGIALTIRQIGIIIIVCLLLDCIMFFIIRYILKNKLNLE